MFRRGSWFRKSTTLILAGGELLIDGVREELYYPVLDAIARRWPVNPPRISIQTTGDVLTPDYLDAMLARGVSAIAIASIDDYHVGMKGERKFRFMQEIRALMSSRGVQETAIGGARDARIYLKARRPTTRQRRGSAKTRGRRLDQSVRSVASRGCAGMLTTGSTTCCRASQ